MDGNLLAPPKSQENGRKRPNPSEAENERPEKRTKPLLEDNTSDEESGCSVFGGVPLERQISPINEKGFTINQDFAKRFEHNKKREELQKLEEKYEQRPTRWREIEGKNDIGDLEHDTESSTDSDDEDDEGVLATGALDEQFHATLKAIRSKDPRVYDEKTTFYIESDKVNGTTDAKEKQKPMYLRDYHRQNLLDGIDGEEAEYIENMTYAQQQADLKVNLVKEMHAAARESAEDSGEDEGFLVLRPSVPETGRQVARVKPAITKRDVEIADKDPETFLSNFMSARAWVRPENSNFQPFESDDDEDDRRAEIFEEAYNLRFEDPKGSNEKLLSHARDAAAKYSVRREATNPRKKARDVERARKEAEKQEREEEKARLRKLKVADVEEKVQKIKEAAGLRSTALPESEWATFLEENWDDDRWEQEMKKRFGEDYYADKDLSGSNGEAGTSRRKTKKPTWENDINIEDLIPNYRSEDDNQTPPFTLTDEEMGHENAGETERARRDVISSKIARASRKRDRDEHKKEARKERRKIEQLVDEELHADQTISGSGTKHAGQFRYRATSPLAYGLTTHDILMASDSQLNQYAGLKKMAAFRDAEKKRKDKKRLGKKARLRQWRKETFGSEHGPRTTLAELLTGHGAGGQVSTESGSSKATFREGKKGKTRSRKNKDEGKES